MHKAVVVPFHPERAAESWADNRRSSFLPLIGSTDLSFSLSGHNAQPHRTSSVSLCLNLSEPSSLYTDLWRHRPLR